MMVREPRILSSLIWLFEERESESHSVVSNSCGNPTVYTVHGILQAGILEWVPYPFSSRSSQPRNWTGVSCIGGRFFTNWAIREASFKAQSECHVLHRHPSPTVAAASATCLLRPACVMDPLDSVCSQHSLWPAPGAEIVQNHLTHPWESFLLWQPAWCLELAWPILIKSSVFWVFFSPDLHFFLLTTWIPHNSMRDLLGVPVAKNPHSHGRGPGSIPGKRTRSYMPQLWICLPQLRPAQSSK